MALTAEARESGKGAEQEQGGGVKLARGGGNDGGEERMRRREHMFDKVVTPSDVGKLNRLVVPKHFAERHFLPQLLPAAGLAAARLAGAVLRFEDGRGGGRAWAFRFSYWSSSQSYVMTKGWSAFVRDRRLAAGDTVSFCRAGAPLFIDCRRRRRIPPPAAPKPFVPFMGLVATAQRTTSDEARRQFVRLFGVDVEVEVAGADEPPVLLDLQLALMR
ncbi:hypothetical protein ACQ4PT_040143 [Festuca glaucescens]